MLLRILICAILLAGTNSCTPGSSNHPPVFVTGPSSTAPNTRTHITCVRSRPCEVVLHARDFAVNASDGNSDVETSDRIRILASNTSSGPFSNSGLLRPDGKECAGMGSLSCIFQLVTPDFVEGEGFGNVSLGETFERCFIVEEDVHVPSAWSNASANASASANTSTSASSCRSQPRCLQLRIEPDEADPSADRFLGSPVAYVENQNVEVGLGVALRWNLSMSRIYGDFQGFELEYFVAGFGDRLIANASSYIDGYTALIPAAVLLEEGQESVEASFRIIAKTQFETYYSDRSLSVRLWQRTRAVGSQIITSWEGQVLRLFKKNIMGDILEVGNYLSHSLMQGGMTVDSTTETYFAVVADPGDSTQSEPLHLLVVNTRDGTSERHWLGVQDTAVWNLQADEGNNRVVGISNNASGVAVVVLDRRDGDLISFDSIPFPVRFAVSALDHEAGTYFFVDAELDRLQRFNLGDHTLLPALEVSGHASGDETRILGLDFDSSSGLLYLILGSWPAELGQPISLVTFNTVTEVFSDVLPTSIESNLFNAFVVDFASSIFYVFSDDGRISSFDMTSNLTSQTFSEISGTLLDVAVLEDRTPILEGLSPSGLSFSAQQTMSIRGWNFGHHDLSPSIKLDYLDCASIRWRSNREITCVVPAVTESLADRAFDLSIAVAGRETLQVGAGVLNLDAWFDATPRVIDTLVAGQQITISGQAFRTNCELYRVSFAARGERFFSSAPVACSETALVFDAPVWLYPGTDAEVALFFGESTGFNPVPERRVASGASGPVTVSFAEMFGLVSSTRAFAQGGELLQFAGLGFDKTANGQYECHFVRTGEPPVAVSALVATQRRVQCTTPWWYFAHGVIGLQLVKGGAQIGRAVAGLEVNATVDFDFIQTWSSASPTEGPFSGGTAIAFSGAGFDGAQESNYRCVFTVVNGTGNATNQYLNVSIMDSTTLECLTTQEAALAAGLSVVLTLEMDEVPVAYSTGLVLPFEFYPVWTNIFPTSASALGGDIVTVYGVGLLDTSVRYECVFSVQATQVRSFVNEAVDASEVRCPVPLWPNASSNVEVQVISILSSGNTTIYYLDGTLTPAAFGFFLVQEEVLSVSPNMVFAGDATVLRVHGGGFDVTRNDYMCVLEAESGLRLFSNLTTPKNFSSLDCSLPPWFDTAAGTRLLLYQGASLVPSADEKNISVTILPNWRTVNPRSLLATGGTLELTGFGFALNESYSCGLSVGSESDSGVGFALTTTQLICEIPPWRLSAGNATLDVKLGNFSVVALYGNKIPIIETIIRIEPNAASALGGDDVFVHGFGFICPATNNNGVANNSVASNQGGAKNYSLTFHVPNVSATGDCACVNATLLLCTTPPWPYEAGLGQVSAGPGVSGLLAFEWIPLIDGLAIPSQVGAGTETPIDVRGRGFLASATYYFTFRVNESLSALSGEEGVYWSNISNFSLTVEGSAINTTLLRCVTPVWPFKYTEVLMSVRQGNTFVFSTVDLKLVFFQEAFSVSPSSGPMQGSEVLIKGGGFSFFTSYKCAVVRGRDPPAGISSNGTSTAASDFSYNVSSSEIIYSTEIQAINSSDIICVLPGRLTGNPQVKIRVLDVKLNVFLPMEIDYEYLPGMLNFSTSVGFASGGLEIIVEGRGFRFGSTYQLVFHSLDDWADEAYSAPGQVLNSTSFAVTTPIWPFIAGDVIVGLAINGTEEAYGGTLPFNYVEVATTLKPSSGLALGGVILVIGWGFDTTDKSYRCLIESLTDTSHTLMTALARPRYLSSSQVECHVPRWPHPASRTNVSLLHDGNIVAFGQDLGIFEFLPAWISSNMSASITFDGGTPIRIVGGGFDPNHANGYTCQFSWDSPGSSCNPGESGCLQGTSSDETVAEDVRGPVQAVSWSELICWTPVWLYRDEIVKLRVYVGDELMDKAYQTEPPSTFVGFPGAFNLPSLNTTSNGYIYGMSTVTLQGQNFAAVDMSPKARIGDTGCQATEWLSSTDVRCYLPRGAVLTVGTAVTIVPYRTTNTSDTFTYDGPAILEATAVNATVDSNFTGFLTANVQQLGSVPIFANGRYFQPTLYLRIGGSAEESSKWLSTSSALCRVPTGAGSSKLMVITVVDAVGSKEMILSYDVPSVSASSFPGNVPSSGRVSTTVVGVNFGTYRSTERVTLGFSATSATSWVSDTSVVAKTVPSVSGTRRIAVTSGGVGTATEALSIDRYAWSVQQEERNTLGGTHSNLFVRGLGLGRWSDTTGVRLAPTAVEVTTWISQTSIVCKLADGTAGTIRMAITAGQVVGSLTELYSFNAPNVVSAHAQVDEGLRLDAFSVSGVGVTISRTCTSFSGGICVQYADWLAEDHPVANFEAPSEWIFCKDSSPRCSQLQTFLSNLGVPDVPNSAIWSTVVLQAADMYPTNTLPPTYPTAGVEGSTFVFTAGSSHTGPGTSVDKLRSYSTHTAEWKDWILQVHMISFDDDWMGVSFRYQDQDNYYRFEMNGALGVQRLKKRVGGSTTVLWSVPNTIGYRTGVLYTIRIICVSTTISVFLDTDQDLSLSAVQSEWTPLCGLQPGAADDDFTCDYTDAVNPITSGSFALFEAGAVGTYFLNPRVARFYRLAKHSNMLDGDSKLITVQGSGFGVYDNTLGVRTFATAAEHTVWSSDTATACKIGEGPPQGTMRTLLTVGEMVHSVTEATTYNNPQLSVVFPTNAAATGSVSVTVMGYGLGGMESSAKTRFGSTSCEASRWISQSSVMSMRSAEVSRSSAISITAGHRMGTATEALSSDIRSLSSVLVANRAGTGSSSITVIGGRFGAASVTHGARAHSSCESTGWMSDSSVRCMLSTGLATSVRMAVTSGLAVGSVTELLSFDTSLSVLSRANRAATGSMSVTLMGGSFGTAESTSRTRDGHTDCEGSRWFSDTAVSCNVAASGFSGSSRIVMTVGSTAGSMTEVLSMEMMVSSVRANRASTGSSSITLSGTGLSTFRMSGAVSFGASSAEASGWVSSTSLRCLVGGGLGGSLTIGLTVGMSLGSLTAGGSYDVPSASSVLPTNRAATGSVSVTVLGAGLGTHGSSARMRLGFSSCEASIWQSETSMSGLVSASVAGSLKVSMTAGMSVGSGTQILTYGSASLSSISTTNRPSTGSVSVTVSGSGLGSSFLTSSARREGSACEASMWQSDTSVVCQTGAGVRRSQTFTMTTAMFVGSVTEAASFDAASVSHVIRSNTPATGAIMVTLVGAGMGQHGATGVGQAGATSCEASEWASDSSLTCRTNSLSSFSASIMLTVGLSVQSVTEVLSFDISGSLSSIVRGNWASTGASSLTLQGSGLSMRTPSGTARVGGSACEASAWVSDSSLMCLTPGTNLGTLRVGITAGLDAGSLTEMGSYDAGTISSVAVGNVASWTNATMTMSGAGLGNTGMSGAWRLGGSGCEASEWISTSSISCLVPSTFSNSLILAVTSGRTGGSLTEAMSFDGARISNITESHLPTQHSSSSITLVGAGFGDAMSFGVRLGGSACEASAWLSISSITARAPEGISNRHVFVATAGQQASSITESFSFESPTVSNLETANGDPGQWPSTTLPDRWAGSRSGGNILTVTGGGFGVRDYSVVVSIGNSSCDNTTWVSDASVLCLVPSVESWGSLSANDTTCGNTAPQECLVNHEVSVAFNISYDGADEIESSSNVSYVYACQCDGVQCYDHNYEQGGASAYCSDVDECNATLCNGTTCPPHNCDPNATCSNTVGSFACACLQGFDSNGTVGTFCQMCEEGKYKGSVSNVECTFCGTYSPAGSDDFLDCDAPALRFLFDVIPAAGATVPNNGSVGSALDATIDSAGAFSVASIDGLGETNAFEWTGSVYTSFLELPTLGLQTLLGEAQTAWSTSATTRHSLTVAYWIKADSFTAASRVLEFQDGSDGVFVYAWHDAGASEMVVSNGDATCCPASAGSIVQAPALLNYSAPGTWVHVAFTFASQKYPVRNGSVDLTAADVAYGYGLHTITESSAWANDLKAGFTLGGNKLFDEVYGSTLLSAVNVSFSADLYGGPWVCASRPFNGKFYPVRLLLGGQVECFSNSSGLCAEANYSSTFAECNSSLSMLPRNTTGPRLDPSVAVAWTADFVGVHYGGAASDAVYDSNGSHDPGLGAKASFTIEHPFSFELSKYKMYCSSWRLASCPGNWTLFASSDGTTWVDLGTVSGWTASDWASYTAVVQLSPAPSVEYQFYRLTVHELAGGSTLEEAGAGAAFVNVDELEFWGEEAMTAYYDGANVTTYSKVDGSQRLPGTGATPEMKVGSISGSVALDDFQLWAEALDEEGVSWLLYN